jgi:hypothetical protein
MKKKTYSAVCRIAIDFENNSFMRRLVIFSRLLFVGIALLVAGGCFVGNYKSARDVALYVLTPLSLRLVIFAHEVGPTSLHCL